MDSNSPHTVRVSRKGLAGILALGLYLLVSQSGAQSRPPNIILFLVDDLGGMDVGAYGSRYYETPNIDQLARSGMLFTNAYAASPVCSPTRASILTGKYPARLGITTALGHVRALPPEFPRYRASGPEDLKWLIPMSLRYLTTDEVTIAESLRAAGYRTAHIGKWHLGLAPQYWPDKQGFDVTFHGAPDGGPPRYFSPYGFKAGEITDGPAGEYLTDRLTDEALRFIEESRDRPFLLHLWHFGVHSPWASKKEEADSFKDVKDPRGFQDNPVMAGMIASIDESLGRIVAKLEELRLSERTIIFFFSDNGGTMSVRMSNHLFPTNNSPLRGAKGTLFEGGTRVPLIVKWPGVIKPGSRSSEVVSSIDLYPTFMELASATFHHKVDGRSFVPTLKGTGSLSPRELFFYAGFPQTLSPGAGVSVRRGDWKMIRWFETSPWSPHLHELYNLTEDLSESVDVSQTHPAMVRELDKSLDQFLDDTGILRVIPNPAYSAKVAALGGWKPKGVETELTGSSLRCSSIPSAEEPWHGLVRQFLEHSIHSGRVGGPYLLRLRARTGETLRMRAVVRSLREEAAGETREFALTGKGDWETTDVELQFGPAPVEVSLQFEGVGRSLEIESIELLSAAGSPRYWPGFTNRLEWHFNDGVD